MATATQSKSDVIRDIIKGHPDITVTGVQETLAKRKIKASDALVSKLLKDQRPKRLRRRSPGTRLRERTVNLHIINNRELCALADRIGLDLGEHIASLKGGGTN